MGMTKVAAGALETPFSVMVAKVESWLGPRPLTLERLADLTNKTRREVEREVQSMRLEGVAIVSDGNGIRLARDSEDALLCAQRLRRRAIEQLVTARALRQAGRRMALAEAEKEGLTLW